MFDWKYSENLEILLILIGIFIFIFIIWKMYTHCKNDILF